MNHINKLSILRKEIIQIANKHGFKLSEEQTPVTIEQSYEIICRLDKMLTQQEGILSYTKTHIKGE